MRQPKIIKTLRHYNWPYFRADAVAGISVALVALPLCIAIAIASGSTPAVGLVTAIVGGLIVSLTGGSRVQIGGPTGAFIVVVYAAIQTHGMDGLLLATMMAGVILIVAGFFRAGRLIAWVPEPVIDGFTIGIAVIIAASQIKDALGLSLADVPAEFLPKLAALWAVRDSVSPATAAITTLAVALIVVGRMWRPRWPVLVIAVGGASAVVAGLGWPVETIASRFGALELAFPLPSLPPLSLAKLVNLLPTALTIAFLAGVESLLSAVVADRMFAPGKHRPSAELLAQGYANLLTPLVGGLPVTGAIARTATNVRAGGKTPVAGVVHALVIALCILIAAPVIGQLALAALAAVLLVTAWTMAEPVKWRHHLALPWAERCLLIGTAALTIFADLAIAIAAGVAAGTLLRWARGQRSPVQAAGG